MIRDLVDELVDEPEDRGSPLPGVRLVLQRTWWVIVGITIGLLAGLGCALVLKPDYASTAILTVSSPDSVDPGNLSRAAQALARVATAPGVVGTPLLDAGLADAADAPREYITVEAAPNAPIISVTGSSPDPGTAQAIARTVGDTLARLGPLPPFIATVVAPAPVPQSPTRPWWSLPLGAAGVGAVLSLVAAATVPARPPRHVTPPADGPRPAGV